MKQIMIRVSKLDNSIGHAAKNLLLNYTEVSAKEIIKTIHEQALDNISLAHEMYGRRTVSQCHTILYGSWDSTDDFKQQLVEGGRL